MLDYNRYVNTNGNGNYVEIQLRGEDVSPTTSSSFRFVSDLKGLSNSEFPNDHIYPTTTNDEYDCYLSNFHTIRGDVLNQQSYQFEFIVNLWHGPTHHEGYWGEYESVTDLTDDLTPQFSVVPWNSVYQNASRDMLFKLQQGTSTSSIKKPLLIVDGDDPVNSKSRYYYWKNRIDLASSMSSLNLDLEQYDIYLLTFNDSRIDLRKNAMATLQAAQFVHSLYANDNAEGTVIAGFSMGGILTRYALAFAEQNNIAHYCRQYIAIDSPQRGAMLNWNFQHELNDLQDDLATIFAGDPILNLTILGFDSISAKQLIRTSAFVDNNDVLGNTNTVCLDFFSEINLEDRDLYRQNGHSNALASELLNYTGNQKPGFPYKQNMIQSTAICNGMLTSSGNINNNNKLVVIHTPIPDWIYSSDRTVWSMPYDCQPGSVAGLTPKEDQMYNYDLPIAATRSTLFLHNASKSGLSPTDNQLDTSNYNTISTSLIPAGWTPEEYLADHSYFDKVIYKTNEGMPTTGSNSGPAWYWKHGADDQNLPSNNVIGKFLAWSEQLENRVTCFISGNVLDDDNTNISVKAYVNGVQLPSSPDYDHVQADGTWKIPYTFVNSADVNIVFEKPNYAQVSKIVHVTYNSSLGIAQSINHVHVSISGINFANIKVSKNNSDFESISAALSYIHELINDGQVISVPIQINISHSDIPYSEHIDLSFLPASIPSLTMNGLSSDVSITGNLIANSESIIHLVIFKNLILENSSWAFIRNIQHVTLDGCKIRNCTDANAICSAVPITFNNCEINNNSGSIYSVGGAIVISNTTLIMDKCNLHDNAGSFGGGINVHGSISVAITNTIFENNQSTGDGGVDNSGTPGGAIYLEDCNNILIDKNQFLCNITSGSGGPLALDMTSPVPTSVHFTITNNKFINNTLAYQGGNYRGSIGPSFAGFLFSDATSIFSNNIINSTDYPGDFMIAGTRCSGTMHIDNCDFIMNISTSNEYGAIFQKYSSVSTNFDNCIFQTGTRGTYFTRPMPSVYSTNTVMYSLFNYGYTGVDNPINVSANVSDMNLDSDFHPIWNATVKSPCIDNGDPNTNNHIHVLNIPWDEDSDRSRYDIGALLPLPTGHRNGLITLEKKEVWNWICIQAIDFPCNPRYADKIMNVFGNFRNNDLFNSSPNTRLLEKMLWLYNNENGYVQWLEQNNPQQFLFSNPDLNVRAQYGFKIQLRKDEGSFVCPETKQLEFDGFQPGNPSNPEPQIEVWRPVINDFGILDPGCSINSATGVLERETWIGYFLDKSMDPFVALAPILPQIVSIKAQDWCVARELTTDAYHHTTYSENWLGGIEGDAKFVINPGEMVAICYIGNADVAFQWGGTELEPPYSPYFKREKPEHFVYNEKEDYLPIFAYIDLSGYEVGKEPTEIAIYVDGVCKGAEKITGEEIQLKAYVMDDPDFEEETVEFKLWSPIKSASETNANYQVMNNQTGIYSLQSSSLNRIGNYARVRLDSPDLSIPQLPSVSALLGNYPNPFNPETTIKYNLAKQSKVNLVIYNVKGQRVKTLVNETKMAGYYSVKWDGKDENGHQVSSGVYFTRFVGDNKSLTKKMILLK